ncbi:DUF6193 family natural product biosynthesis protein [Kitasatospora sp. NPDC094015]|uniref:DUF6193 family natural product biosynthesis protein n=1 Tax=Kitasatospora sp. NPDC094015 TaxID=3155205 RepID=UPI00332F7F62
MTSDTVDPTRYPDLAAAGTLAAALERLSAELGLDLGPVTHQEADPYRAELAGAAPDRGPCVIEARAGEPRFTLSCRSGGIELLRATGAELRELAEVAAVWHGGGSLHEVRPLVRPSVTFRTRAEAREHGPAHTVEFAWRWLHERARHLHRFPGFRLLVEAAYAQPRLRGLYPHTSHHILRFAGRTTYPFPREAPFVEPCHDGCYRVHAATGGAVLHESASAAEAVAVVLAHLPADLGPVTS